MSFNVVIGMGNTGCQIVKAAALSDKLSECHFYTIDSVVEVVDMNTVNKIKHISLISDDKAGSGRSRERGAAMFNFQDKNGALKELYADAEKAKTPILVITSAAGGTGSGSTPALCQHFINQGISVIPIIVCPAMEEPTAFHLNTSDLMMELGEAGVETYQIFRNEYGKADYSNINKEVVTGIEIILGKHYDDTDKDSIDDSDLDVILGTPGRFIAVKATAQTPTQLKQQITESVLNGHQPFTSTDASATTLMTAFALSSPFASGDFEQVFSEINARIKNGFDEYRNICNRDGKCTASIIIAGLPPAELKKIDTEFQTAAGIADGISAKSARPAFMRKKGVVRSVSTSAPVAETKPVETPAAPTTQHSAIDKFNVKNAGQDQ